MHAYHVERDYIAKRDLARLVALHKILVDDDRAASRRQAQNKGLLRGGLEGIDALCADALAGS